MSSRQRFVLLIASGLAMPAGASAQACVGLPLRGGQFMVMGSTGFARLAKSYTGSIGVNVAGPVTIVAGYSFKDFEVDRDANTVSGSAAYEFSVDATSICPTAGIARTTDSSRELEAEVVSLMIPIGFGIAHSFAAGELMVTLFSVPQFMYVERRTERVEDDVDIRAFDVAREFSTTFGFRLGSNAVFGGAGVILSTGLDAEAALGVNLGLILGTS